MVRHTRVTLKLLIDEHMINKTVFLYKINRTRADRPTVCFNFKRVAM